MRTKFYIISFTFALIMHINMALARELSVPKQIEHLTIGSGLTHNAISSLMTDSSGYLWVGTFDGVSVYNGKSVSQIRSSNRNQTLLSNRVRSLAESSNGDIFIATEKGLNLYERKTNSFVNVIQQASIRRVVYNKLTDLLCAVDLLGRIYTVDSSLSVEQSSQLPSGVTVIDMTHLNERTILLHTNMGLWVIECDKRCKLVKVDMGSVASVDAVTVFDENVVFLVSSSSIVEGDVARRADGGYVFVATHSSTHPVAEIRSIDVDQDGGMWLCGANHSLYYIADIKRKDSIKTIALDSRCVLSSVYCESPDKIWVMTFDNGLFRVSKSGNKIFTDLFADMDKQHTKMLHYEVVGEDQVMVKTQTGELVLYGVNPLREMRLSPQLDKYDISSNKLIFCDRSRDVWLFNSNGSFTLCRVDGSILRGKLVGIDVNVTRVPLSCVEDAAGCIWLSYGNGIYRFVPNKNNSTQQCSALMENKFFDRGNPPKSRVLYADPMVENTIWIGTKENGLLQVTNAPKIEDCTIKSFVNEESDPQSLPSNFVSAIIRHSNGSLWVGTESGGIARLDDNYGVGFFTTFDTNQGLSNDVVKSMIEDRKGQIWIGTNYGLNIMNVDSGTIYSYNNNSGLPFSDFWYEAKALSNGDLLFAGVNGLLLFNPDRLSRRVNLPNFSFSSLKIQNTLIEVGDEFNGRVVVDQVLDNGSVLSLESDENTLSVGVDIIDFDINSNYYITYQLLPASETWITLPASLPYVSLNGMPTGNYELRIAVSDSFGNTTPYKSLFIDVDYPPMLSPLHFALYFIIFMIVIMVVVMLFLHNKRTKYMLDMETQQVANLKSLNEEKQRYFSNISHELKTPLALIVAPIESLAQRFKFDVDITSKIDIVMRQSRRMLQLIDSTHKLHLDELNMLNPIMSHFDISLFVEDIVDDFRFEAEYSGKILHTKGVPIVVEADRAMLEMALCNILNNAFKYTHSGDEIVVEYYQLEDNNIVIKVKDSGLGVAQEELVNIFDRYYMGKSSTKSQSGSGIGLSFTKRIIELHGGTISAESRLGYGATFTLTLPIKINYVGSQMQLVEKSSGQLKQSLAESMILDDTQEINIPEALRNSLVYVVDDNPLMCSTIGSALSQYFQVMTFNSGDECLTQIETLWPQIVVSDVVMENGDGFELCDKIKSNMMTSHIPVILLTGCNSLDDKMKGYDSGADNYISKPFYLKHLISRVAYLLNSREELRRRFEIGVPFTQLGGGTDVDRENKFISQLYEIFERHIEDDQIDIDYIASQLSMSRSSLYQKVKMLTGSATYELLKEYRLKRAAELLAEGELNVTEVFMSVGFKHRTHFSRLFKERYGVSPSKYVRTINPK